MDYQELCRNIFGTDNPQQLFQIAKKAHNYDLLYSGETIVNRRNAGRKQKVKSEEAWEMQKMYNLGSSIEQIAKAFCVTRPTVYKYINLNRRWEKEKFVKVRMEYMYEEEVCSIIDVDFYHRKVFVENRTNQLILTAFGVNRHPDWEDFQEFLESRCFPRTRCQAKQILRENGMDFYEPMAIIEKTQGRMAEDHHWLRIRYKE